MINRKFLPGKHVDRGFFSLRKVIKMFQRMHGLRDHGLKVALMPCILLIICLLQLLNGVAGIGEIVWAVNAGGEAHTDIFGIPFQTDTLSKGISSDFGRSLIIQRVHPQDQILYQTERYDTSSFGYEVPIKRDGQYVLVLKFCEVYFSSPNQKVFDVRLNEISVIDRLDIFAKVGRGVAHDEIIPFQIIDGELHCLGESTALDAGHLTIDFLKGDKDNPKINAAYIMRGTVSEIPMLPQLQASQEPVDETEEEDEDLEEESRKQQKRKSKPPGPKVQDPYAADDTGSMMLPVFVAVGAFIPLLFCLCKL